VQGLIIGLRVVHILTGVFWVGTMLFTTFYLFPVLGAAGPAAAGPVMGGLQRRGFMTSLPVAAVLTLLSGMTLLQLTSGGSMAAFMRSRTGATFAGAGLLAVVAFVLGIVVSRPAAMTSARLGQQLATVTDPAERERIQQQIRVLQGRAMTVSRVVAVMLIITAIGMAVARYL
jgi:uncharacterized membrane protein